MSTEQRLEYRLTPNSEERAVLSSILEESLMEIHPEKRPTEAPRYRDRMQHQEAVVRGILDKASRLCL
jgi:hypothetical protein